MYGFFDRPSTWPASQLSRAKKPTIYEALYKFLIPCFTLFTPSSLRNLLPPSILIPFIEALTACNKEGTNPMKIILGYLAQTLFLSVSMIGEYSSQKGEMPARKMPAGFEDDAKIPHARLAHFPAQIGHWRMSSRITNHFQ